MPIITNKKIGETPLELIERIKKDGKINKDKKATYAGRLDPAASGLMIILEGDEVFDKEKYLKLDKEYVVEFIFGLETDTGDLFGILRKQFNADLDKEMIKDAFNSFVGKYNQRYPIFSSKTVNGKQLFSIADEISADGAPEHEVELKEVKDFSFNKIKSKEIKDKVSFLLKNINGKFRYEEIEKSWNDLKDDEFISVKVNLKVSSGFYIRQLAFDLAKKINIPVVTYSIDRTVIGSYKK